MLNETCQSVTRGQILWSHIHDAPGVVKFIDIERRRTVARGWGARGMGSYFLMGAEFHFCNRESSRDRWRWWLHNNVRDPFLRRQWRGSYRNGLIMRKTVVRRQLILITEPGPELGFLLYLISSLLELGKVNTIYILQMRKLMLSKSKRNSWKLLALIRANGRRMDMRYMKMSAFPCTNNIQFEIAFKKSSHSQQQPKLQNTGETL